MFLQPYALMSLDGIRVYFGKPVLVNNWAAGGQSENRGFRPTASTVGVPYSQHRYGNAFDIDVQGVDAESVRQEIIKNKDLYLFCKIMCMETGITYVHFDCRNISDRIRLVNP